MPTPLLDTAHSELRNPQLDVPGRDRDQPIPIPVALRGAGLGPLMRLDADPRRRLSLDQRLEHRLHRPADDIVGVSGLQRIQQLEQGRLIQRHRVHLLRGSLVGSRKDSHDGPSQSGSRTATYTTPRVATDFEIEHTPAEIDEFKTQIRNRQITIYLRARRNRAKPRRSTVLGGRPIVRRAYRLG